jgi:hypothetical protein
VWRQASMVPARQSNQLTLVRINLFPRTPSRIGARRGAGNKFASGSFAENCSSDARLRQFCNFPDASRTLPNLNSDESAPA